MHICDGGRWRGCRSGRTSIDNITNTNNNINDTTSTTTTTSVSLSVQNHDLNGFGQQPHEHLQGVSPSTSGVSSGPADTQHRGLRILSAKTEDHNHCRLQNNTASLHCETASNSTTSTVTVDKSYTRLFTSSKENRVPSSVNKILDNDKSDSWKKSSLRCPDLPRVWAPQRPSTNLSQTRHSNLFTALLALLLLFASLSDACAPRGGSGSRRHRRKLTPLVFKQHVPNVSENTLGASGLSDGPINRGDPRFKDLVRNFNPNIWFRDEEGTGADRIMSQRCLDKLNILAISVLNQWPGVKLRVTEAWDEDMTHVQDSLHYEGRAVDITTSDMDRTKYGMLARLAVEAGFDWVYYESRSHVHCSVKSDSSVAINFGGCYAADSQLSTPGGGSKTMAEVKVGDKVLSTNPEDGTLVFSEVVAFLDRNPHRAAAFYTVRTASGHALTLTGKHLLYYLTQDDVQRRSRGAGLVAQESGVAGMREETKGNNLFSSFKASNTSLRQAIEDSRLYSEGATQHYKKELPHGRLAYAEELEVGQYLLKVPPLTSLANVPKSAETWENKYKSPPEEKREILLTPSRDTGTPQNQLTPDRIVSIETKTRKGVFAPLTAKGTVVVDGYVTSCYAFLKDVNLAHNVMAPVRAYHVIKVQVNDWLDSVIKPAFGWLNFVDLSRTSMSSQSHPNSTLSSEVYSTEQDGAHWYARMLYSIAVNVLHMDILISI